MKRVAGWLLTFMLIAGLFLVACGPEAAEPTVPPTEETKAEEPAAEAVVEEEHEPVTLTYWHGAPAPPLEPAMAALVDQFMEEYPWITVNIESFGFGEYFQKLDTATAGGTAPDVFWVDITSIATYAYYDMIIPLTDLVADDYADDWFQIPREAMFYEGELWAIPLHQSTEAIVYNQEITDAAGLEPPEVYDESWDFGQWRDALDKVTKQADDGTTEVWGWSTQYPPGVYNLQPWMYAYGATYMDPDNTTFIGYTDSDIAVEALDWYAHLFLDGYSPVDRIPDIFQTGKVAFFQTNPFVLVDIQNRYPDLAIGVMPMPCEERCAVQSGAWHIGIHSQSEHPEEAWMLIDYITDFEGHKQWIETSGYMPARISVYEAIPKMKEYPWTVFMEGLMNHAVHRPANVAWQVFNSEMTNAAKNVAVGAEPRPQLEHAAQAAETELDEYR